ncbi:hypothetical protein P355_1476 [Burkholderia cenocepacia KC-01]|nr:hypothetical protein P355_1476 [Burkholderia cenocepacia KC-01]
MRPAPPPSLRPAGLAARCLDARLYPIHPGDTAGTRSCARSASYIPPITFETV